MKKSLLLLLVPGLMFLLTGCGKGVSQSDVKKYVKKTYGFQDFEVASEPTVVDGNDGFKNEIWTVTAKDRWNTEFEVWVHRSESSSLGGNAFTDNYYGKVLKQVTENYNPSYLDVTETNQNGFCKYELVGHFTDKDGLQALCEEAKRLCDAMRNDDIEIEINVCLCMDTPFQDLLTEQPDGSDGYQAQDTVYRKTVHTDSAEKETETVYSEALELLVQVALDYRLEDSLFGIPEEQLSEIYETSCKKIGIVRNGQTEYYDGMCANRLSYGISFGNLYQVLVNEGIFVEGDEEHYSFYGADGNFYGWIGYAIPQVNKKSRDSDLGQNPGTFFFSD